MAIRLHGRTRTTPRTQNAYIERFNKTYRTEVLDCYVFDNLQDVCEMTADWQPPSIP